MTILLTLVLVARALGIDPSELADSDEEEDPLDFGTAVQRLFDRAFEAKFAALERQAVEA